LSWIAQVKNHPDLVRPIKTKIYKIFFSIVTTRPRRSRKELEACKLMVRSVLYAFGKIQNKDTVVAPPFFAKLDDSFLKMSAEKVHKDPFSG